MFSRDKLKIKESKPGIRKVSRIAGSQWSMV